jgi:hypothetical protein
LVGAPFYSGALGRVYAYMLGGDPDNALLNAGCDNCPHDANADQENSDADVWGDLCDNCPLVANNNQAITIINTGDVNMDGSYTSADIIVKVNFIFKSGEDPLPCAASADVNCDGATTSADIIHMVNHVFKGGPPPCDVCTGSAVAWPCN